MYNLTVILSPETYFTRALRNFLTRNIAQFGIRHETVLITFIKNVKKSAKLSMLAKKRQLHLLLQLRKSESDTR